MLEISEIDRRILQLIVEDLKELHYIDYLLYLLFEEE